MVRSHASSVQDQRDSETLSFRKVGSPTCRISAFPAPFHRSSWQALNCGACPQLALRVRHGSDPPVLLRSGGMEFEGLEPFVSFLPLRFFPIVCVSSCEFPVFVEQPVTKASFFGLTLSTKT